MKWLQEFKEFVARGNAFDLAIGVIVGGAFGPVVTSMVNDLILPVVSLGLGRVDFRNLYLPLTPAGVAAVAKTVEAGDPLPTLEQARAAGAVLSYGLFINSLVSFVALMFGVFLLIKAVNAVRRIAEVPPPKPAGPTKSEALLEEIRDLLKRSA